MRLPGGNRGSGNDPLLRVGMIMMAFALGLALVTVVLTILLRGVPERAVALERKMSANSPAGSLVHGESPVKPSQENARPLPAPEITKNESNPAPSASKSELSVAPAPKAAEMRSRSEPLPQQEPQGQPEPKAQSDPKPEPTTGPRTSTVGEGDWTRPTPQEIEAANRPRHYHMPQGAIMSLTIPSIGIYGAPVFDSASPMALARGVAHLPDTSLPWSETPQKNVYLAGHRMGLRGTWSRMIFYKLNELGEGERVLLRDPRGGSYEYRVSEVLIVGPSEQWVTGQLRGRDMLSLQTCTPIPTFDKRLIVRADRI